MIECQKGAWDEEAKEKYPYTGDVTQVAWHL